MGLYQYIREQAHRNDLIGELGRWMSQHYNERPDHNSSAFELASKEFTACGNWTRQEAIKLLNENKQFQNIVKIEPRISPIISEALKIRTTKGYNRHIEYERLKAELIHLVGYKAENEKLKNSESYEVVIIDVISRILPPDSGDLYPSGLLSNEEYEQFELDL